MGGGGARRRPLVDNGALAVKAMKRSPSKDPIVGGEAPF